MDKKNVLDTVIEKSIPEPLRKYTLQIVAYLVFIIGLTLMGWLFGNRFLISLGLGSLIIYVVVMTIVVINVLVLKR